MNLLLLLCLLSPWFGPTSSQEIKHHVVTVTIRENALLPCALDSGQSIDKFDWRKDNGQEKKEVFSYDRGSYYGYGLEGQSEQFKYRVVFFQHELGAGNASIVIQETRLEDNGTYTCVLFEPHRQEINIRLNINAVFVSVAEGEDAVLPCYLNIRPNVKDLEFTWKKDEKEVFLFDREQVKKDQQFTGRVKHFEYKISYGIVSIKISNTWMNDSGRYTCHSSNIQKSIVILQIIGKKSRSEHSVGLYIAVAVLTPISILLFIGVMLSVCYRLKKRSATPM